MKLTFIITVYNMLKNAHHRFQQRNLDGAFPPPPPPFIDGLT